MLNVQDIGEYGLLKKLQSFCPASIVGDDGAVLSVEPDQSLVVTTDVLVDEVHFSDRTTTAYDVGWRAAAANLSDLAAMGAKPLGITVGLSLPGEVAVSWVEELYQGMFDCLSQYQTSIVGGDICRSRVITVAITAMGQVSPHGVISRYHAQPGDAIVVTGLHGLSRAGLELLLNPNLGHDLSKTERERLIKAHQRPKPRLDVISWLEKNASHVRIAGMDSSDGLADAIAQICQCSQVGAEIEANLCQILPSLTKLRGTEQAFDWMLYGGEDFELVLCLPPKIASALVEYLGQDGAIIGKVVSNLDVTLINQDNGNLPQKLNLNRRIQHF